MAKYRFHSIEFKRQVTRDYLAGETLHGLAKRHDIRRNSIRVRVAKDEAGEFDVIVSKSGVPSSPVASRYSG